MFHIALVMCKSSFLNLFVVPTSISLSKGHGFHRHNSNQMIPILEVSSKIQKKSNKNNRNNFSPKITNFSNISRVHKNIVYCIIQ